MTRVRGTHRAGIVVSTLLAAATLAGCAAVPSGDVSAATYTGFPSGESSGVVSDDRSFGMATWIGDDRFAVTARMYSFCHPRPVALDVESPRTVAIEFVADSRHWPCTGGDHLVTWEFDAPDGVSRVRPVELVVFGGTVELPAQG